MDKTLRTYLFSLSLLSLDVFTLSQFDWLLPTASFSLSYAGTVGHLRIRQKEVHTLEQHWQVLGDLGLFLQA